MEFKESTNKDAGSVHLSTFGKIRGMLGPKRRLVGPFIVAVVLLSAVSLFLLISDKLISQVATGITPPVGTTMPGVILPGSADWINPEDVLPELKDVFTVSGAENTMYLRCFVGSKYDGQFWLKSPSSSPQRYNGQELTYDVSGYSSSTTDDITITPLVEFAPGYIPASLYTTILDSKESLLRYPESSVFYLNTKSQEMYQFSSMHYEFDQEVLEAAEVLDDALYLQLPDNITNRTKELALEITADCDSPYDKAKTIERYLLTSYEYTTDFSASPEGVEATDWFLFEDKKGIHTHFSSAYTVLARYAGLPTRIVSGYFIFPQAKEQTVSTLQAITLAEVGYKELGWISLNTALGTQGTGIAIETFTYIDGISDTSEVDEENPYAAVIEKDRPFYVSGRVETEDGFSVLGMPVAIWLATADGPKPDFSSGLPDISALLVGGGVVTEDGYSVECNVPADLVAGQWRVVTQSLGVAPFYMPSDSDPEITIRASSQFVDVVVPSIISVGEVVAFTGKLTDAENDSIPIPLVPIEINIIGGIDEIIDTLPGNTLLDGSFVVLYQFDEAEDYNVTVSFAGGTYYKAAMDVTIDTHVSHDTVLTLDMVEEVKDGTNVNISGKLTTAIYGLSTGTPLSGRALSIYQNDVLDDTDEDVLVGEVVTDAGGNYSLDLIFADSGHYAITVQYEGQEFYNTSEVSQEIKVYGPPTMTLTMDTEKDIYDPGKDNRIPLHISLIDEFGEPLASAQVYLKTQKPDASEENAGPFLTNEDGIIDNITFKGLQVGVYTVTAVFEEIALFPETEDSVDVTVWMPTAMTMNDLSAFANIKQGTTLIIEGTLLDYWGAALVAGTNVNIMNGSEVLTTTTTDVAGNYSVGYDFDDSGDYQVYASFTVDDVNFYRASESTLLQDVRVYGPPTLDLTVPARQDIDDQPVTIEGHLYDEYGNNLPGETVIIQFTDGSADIPVGTGIGGLFSGDHTFAAVGDYTITAVFDETALYPSVSSSADITIMMPTVLTVTVPAEQKLGLPVTISGTLVDAYGAALGGETIMLKDGSTLITTVVTLGDGSYTYDHTFASSGDHSINAEFTENVYLKSSAASDVIRVYGPPTIELTVPQKEDQDVAATISGHLYDEFGNDLVGYTVDITISDGTPVVHLSTDADGLFSLEHAFDTFGDYTVTASFAAAGLYPPATDDVADIRIMIATTVALDMPDYVKIDIEVPLVAELTETDSGDPVVGQTIRIYDGITLIASEVTDTEGKISFAHTFASQGVHTIKADFDETDYYRGASISQVIEVRIGTSLVLDIADSADVGDAVSYEGYLYDEFGNPLANQPVFIHVGSKKASTRLITNASGNFVLEDVFAIGGYLTDGSDSPLAGQTIDVLIDDGDSLIPLGQMVTLPNGGFILTGIDLVGSVSDGAGGALAGHTIDLELDHSMFFPLAKLLTDGDGDYSLANPLGLTGTVTSESGGVVVGAAVVLGLYDGVDTVELLDNESTDADGGFSLNRDIVVQGTLLDPVSDPMAHEDIQLSFIIADPDLLIGDDVNEQVITNAAGYFTIIIDGIQYARIFTEVGDYTVSAFYSGSSGYLPARDNSDIAIYMPTTLTATAPQQAKVGTTVTITGSLVDEGGNPLVGQAISIEIETSLSKAVVTGENGQFSLEHIYDGTGEYAINVSYNSKGYFKSSIQTMDINISGEPVLTLDAPVQARQRSWITIDGTIIDEFETPLAGAEILFSIVGVIDDADGGSDDYAAIKFITADAEGGFSERHKFDDTGDYHITVSYAGSNLYLSTEISSNLKITQQDYGVSIEKLEGTQKYLWWVLIGSAIIAGAYVAFVLNRKARAKLGYMMAASGSTFVLDEGPASVATMAKSPDAANIEIELEQAPPPLTDVWGVNEEFAITCRVYDRKGVSLADGQLELWIDDRKLDRIVTDNTGSVSVYYSFRALGMYNIRCHFVGDSENRPWTESKMLKVVDFRAEAIGLFDSIAALARRRGVSISKRLTPREIERRIVSSLKSVDQKVLDRFIGCAEEALYSSHDFTRDSYIDMLGIYETVREPIEEA